MSGGRWNYQSYRLETLTEELGPLLAAVARTEHLIDWAESADTLRADAEREVYDLWVETFNRLYDH